MHRRVIVGDQLPTRWTEQAVSGDSYLLKFALQHGGEDSEAILHAATEIDGRCFLEVLGGAGDFADAIAEVNGLRQNLIVEDEVIRVLQQRKIQEDLPAESPEAGVILGQLCTGERI